MNNLLFDYHIHSKHSPDCSMELQNIVDQAMKLGLREICITDHMEVDNTFGPEWPLSKESVAAQLNDVAALKEKTGGYVRKGIELGLPDHAPGTVEDLTELINPDDYDFIIASLHQYNELSPFTADFYSGRSLADTARLYISWINERIRALPLNYFDSVGHIDFVVKGVHGLYDPSLKLSYFEDEVRELFTYLIENGKTIEVNTSAYKALPNNKTQGLDWLRLFAQMGGEYVTLASDAHKINYIGYRLPEAIEIIKEAGIPYIASFDRRRPVMHKIN